MQRFDPARLRKPLLLAASCLLPYLIYSIPTGQFRVSGFLMLTGISLVMAFWYRVLPGGPVTDVLFVALAASIYISKVFDLIYISPIPKVPSSRLPI